MFVKAHGAAYRAAELCFVVVHRCFQVAQVLSVRPEAVPEEYRKEFRKSGTLTGLRRRCCRAVGTSVGTSFRWMSHET